MLDWISLDEKAGDGRAQPAALRKRFSCSPSTWVIRAQSTNLEAMRMTVAVLLLQGKIVSEKEKVGLPVQYTICGVG